MPSGLKWAKCNLGANVPESTGLYYSWGNTDGHPAGGGYDFSQEAYNGTPGASIETDLTNSEDAARVSLGSPWRMPTVEDFQELDENCSHEKVTLNGVAGMMYTSLLNGKQIFLPSAGFYNGVNLSSKGVYGHYWGKSYASEDNAYNLYWSDAYYNVASAVSRRYGFTIRPVYDPNL